MDPPSLAAPFQPTSFGEASRRHGLNAIAANGGGDNPMSEFVFLFRATEAAQREALGTPEVAQRSLQKWLAWIRDLEVKGYLKNPGQPLEVTGKVVRGKARVVTDGPYAESKDLLLGFIIVEARDLAEATELSTGCPMLDGGGSVEIRPVGTLNV
jgi:hypothetical protein